MRGLQDAIRMLTACAFMVKATAACSTTQLFVLPKYGHCPYRHCPF
jgi:hypothetical protein